MRRPLVAGAAVVLIMACAAAILARPANAAGRAYTVAQVRAGLSRDPRGWIDRTIFVRGVVMRCLRVEGCYGTPAGIPSIGLVDGIPIVEAPRTMVLSQSLPLLLERDPLRAYLRRAPFIRAVLPTPQRLSLTQAAVYRVRLSVLAPCSVERINTPCIVAYLVDAA
jgi:hypothetical protein